MLFLVLSGLATEHPGFVISTHCKKETSIKLKSIDKSSTILTILLALIFLHEGLSWAKAGCVCLIGIGTMMMITRKETTDETTAKDGELAHICGTVSSICKSDSNSWKDWNFRIDSSLGTAIRTTVVLAMAWLMVFMKGKQHEVGKIEKKNLFIGLSGIATGASWLCYYRALQEGPASVVVPIDKLSILVTIAFPDCFPRKLTRKFQGVVLITAGLYHQCMIGNRSHGTSRGGGFGMSCQIRETWGLNLIENCKPAYIGVNLRRRRLIAVHFVMLQCLM